MVSLYLKSIIMWFIIIQATIIIFKDSLLNRMEVKSAKIRYTITLSCIPILRIIIWVLFIYIAIGPEDKIKKLIKEAKELD